MKAKLKPYRIYPNIAPPERLRRGDLNRMIQQMKVGDCIAVTGLQEANAVNILLRGEGYQPLQRKCGDVVLVWKLEELK
jgi:hypothetical protein